jgi:hypothetical protein
MITPVARGGNSAPTRCPVRRIRNKYDDDNRQSALIIVAAADDLGEDGVLVQWARAFLAKDAGLEQRSMTPATIFPEIGHEPFNVSPEELAEASV